jgi:hypothetical protein
MRRFDERTRRFEGALRDMSARLASIVLPDGSPMVLQKTITGRQTTPLYWGHRWKTAAFGAPDANRQYDVRISNLSGKLHLVRAVQHRSDRCRMKRPSIP